MEEKRKTHKYRCPKCGRQLAISGWKVCCIDPGCDFKIEAKREEDKNLPSLFELARNFQ